MIVADKRKSRSAIHVICQDQLNRETLQTSGDTSLQTEIPAEFWTELKAQKLIEQNTSVAAWYAQDTFLISETDRRRS